MTWTVTNLVSQIIGGILGAHATAIVLKELSFGHLGHTIAGVIGGAFSGYFLQTLAVTMVNPTGGVTLPTPVENVFIQGVTGAIVGGIVTVIVGFAKHSMEQQRAQKR